VIAHRLLTIVDADQILVMDQGRIVERGSFRELMAANGRFAEMWRLQQEEGRKEGSGPPPESARGEVADRT